MTFMPAQQAEVLVRIETSFGQIDLAIDTKRAPVTSANFLKYVDAGLYDGGRFHRATRPDNYTPAPPNRPPMELIQGGINPDRRAEGFPPIPLETATNHHEKYAVGLAHGDNPNSGQSTFYIDLADNTSLNAKADAPPNTTGFAAFAHVTAGFDTVDKIGAVERLPKGGPFPGKLPKVPVIVKKATVTKAK